MTDCIDHGKKGNTEGYTTSTLNGKTINLHRKIAIKNKILSGPNDPLYTLHKCNNSRCINPEHLYAGTAKENTDDKYAAGRAKHANSMKVECKRGHAFTPENTYWTGDERTCIICRKLKQAEWYKKKKLKVV